MMLSSAVSHNGHLCGDHAHNVLVSKLVRPEVKVVDPLKKRKPLELSIK